MQEVSCDVFLQANYGQIDKTKVIGRRCEINGQNNKDVHR